MIKAKNRILNNKSYLVTPENLSSKINDIEFIQKGQGEAVRYQLF